jgi:ABC-2 type transport system ATP-binding protein
VAGAFDGGKRALSTRRLEVRGLRAGYGARLVIDQVSLSIAPGEWYVLMGPNGCGKSTLLDCVAGRLVPAEGDVLIEGVSLARDAAAAKRRLGYATAPENLPGLLTARQCLEIHAGAKGLRAIDASVLDLAEQLQFVPYLDSFVDTLSLGTRQKLAVLLALVGDPALVVLDEAFNGLDPASALLLKRHLRGLMVNPGVGVLLATHALDIVEHHASRAGLLIDGRIRQEWTRDDIQAALADGGVEAALSAAMTAAP